MNLSMKSMRPKSDADHFPPPRSVGRAVVIALSFPGILIWHLAKYCNSQEGRLAKVGMFVVLSPIFGFSALVWFALIVGLLWRAVQGP